MPAVRAPHNRRVADRAAGAVHAAAMTWYAQTPAKRGRQIAADLTVAAWTALWGWIGLTLHEVVSRLAAPGRALADAGGQLRAAAASAGEQVAGLPLLGGTLAAPFDAVAGAGRTLTGAGTSAQDVVAWLALWPVLALVVPPVLLVLVVHVGRRLRWARDARAAAALRGGADAEALFALRALAHRSLPELQRVAADPYGAFARGDHTALADLELRALGLRRG